MTVEELIEKLKECPEGARVVIVNQNEPSQELLSVLDEPDGSIVSLYDWA